MKTLAAIRRDLPTVLPRVWFSHGLASIIVFGTEPQELAPLFKDERLGFRAFEHWKMDGEQIISSSIEIANVIAVDDLAPFDYPQVDADTRVLLDEFVMCLHTALRCAAQYSPRNIAVFRSLEQSVVELAEELAFLAAPNGNPPGSLPETMWESISSSHIERQRRTHQRVGQLVQINSALSYVISQAFTGTFPLRESECQIRRHSFLGIGTAVNALAATARFVERVFEAHPIDETIKSRYNTLGTGIEVFPLLRGGFDSAAWTPVRFHVDTHIGTVESTPLEPKLVFFSGRLGFREAEFAVTSALQVLSAADSSRWSLMTLTHELMHAHVRAIMAVLFTEPGWSVASTFPTYYQELTDVVRGTRSSTELSLRASLRLAILNYCSIVPWLPRIASGDDSVQAINLASSEQLRTILAQESRAINHVLVHVFDFYYFYNGRTALYLKLLWESWSTVPAVLENVEEYVLRSLVTISTKNPGSDHDRFTLSLAALREELNLIAEKDPTNGVVQRALLILDEKASLQRLEVYFQPRAYLAEIAAKTLVASSVHADLMKDDNAELDDDGAHYVLESGEFAHIDIQSPIAFSVDRLRRALLTPADEEDEEYRSAWALTVIASALF